MKRKLLFGNIKFFKFFDQKNLGSFSRIFFSSIILISFFYSAPMIIQLSKDKNFEFQNNSKKVLAYTLNNKTNPIDGTNETLNENDLLVDILSPEICRGPGNLGLFRFPCQQVARKRRRK